MLTKMIDASKQLDAIRPSFKCQGESLPFVFDFLLRRNKLKYGFVMGRGVMMREGKDFTKKILLTSRTV
jgi:hypothetical protein